MRLKFVFILYVLIFLFDFNMFSQSTCKIFRLNPIFFLREVDSLRNAQKYDEIEKLLYDRIKSDSVKLWHYYQLACIRSLQHDTIAPFQLLSKHIDLKVYADDILTDTDFEPLHKTLQWKKLRDTLCYCYLLKYPNISDRELSLALWLQGIEDQRMRTLKQNWKKPTPQSGSKEWEAMNKAFRKKTQERANFVMEYVNRGIWPTYSMVGEDAGNAAMLIIQHCERNSYLKKTLPLLKVAAEQGEASKIMYVNMLDRYLLHKNKRQIYGTQIIGERNSKTGSLVMFFSPIEDESNVNERRAAMNMEPIEEWAKAMGFTYLYRPTSKRLFYFKAYRDARKNGQHINMKN
ncbi:MAG: DUF6624 domain-containing protein [Bacteroidales bacterium]